MSCKDSSNIATPHILTNGGSHAANSYSESPEVWRFVFAFEAIFAFDHVTPGFADYLKKCGEKFLSLDAYIATILTETSPMYSHKNPKAERVSVG